MGRMPRMTYSFGFLIETPPGKLNGRKSISHIPSARGTGSTAVPLSVPPVGTTACAAFISKLIVSSPSRTASIKIAKPAELQMNVLEPICRTQNSVDALNVNW